MLPAECANVQVSLPLLLVHQPPELFLLRRPLPSRHHQPPKFEDTKSSNRPHQARGTSPYAHVSKPPHDDHEATRVVQIRGISERSVRNALPAAESFAAKRWSVQPSIVDDSGALCGRFEWLAFGGFGEEGRSDRGGGVSAVPSADRCRQRRRRSVGEDSSRATGMTKSAQGRSIPTDCAILLDRFGDGLAIKCVFERKRFDDPRCGISANQVIINCKIVIAQIELSL